MKRLRASFEGAVKILIYTLLGVATANSTGIEETTTSQQRAAGLASGIAIPRSYIPEHDASIFPVELPADDLHTLRILGDRKVVCPEFNNTFISFTNDKHSRFTPSWQLACGVDLPEGDIPASSPKAMMVSGASACAIKCQQELDCKAVVFYHRPSPMDHNLGSCHLKKTLGRQSENSELITWVRRNDHRPDIALETTKRFFKGPRYDQVASIIHDDMDRGEDNPNSVLFDGYRRLLPVTKPAQEDVYDSVPSSSSSPSSPPTLLTALSPSGTPVSFEPMDQAVSIPTMPTPLSMSFDKPSSSVSPMSSTLSVVKSITTPHPEPSTSVAVTASPKFSSPPVVSYSVNPTSKPPNTSVGMAGPLDNPFLDEQKASSRSSAASSRSSAAVPTTSVTTSPKTSSSPVIPSSTSKKPKTTSVAPISLPISTGVIVVPSHLQSSKASPSSSAAVPTVSADGILSPSGTIPVSNSAPADIDYPPWHDIIHSIAHSGFPSSVSEFTAVAASSTAVASSPAVSSSTASSLAVPFSAASSLAVPSLADSPLATSFPVALSSATSSSVGNAKAISASSNLEGISVISFESTSTKSLTTATSLSISRPVTEFQGTSTESTVSEATSSPEPVTYDPVYGSVALPASASSPLIPSSSVVVSVPAPAPTVASAHSGTVSASSTTSATTTLSEDPIAQLASALSTDTDFASKFAAWQPGIYSSIMHKNTETAPTPTIVSDPYSKPTEKVSSKPVDTEAENDLFWTPEGIPYADKSDRICKDAQCDSFCIPSSRYADVQAGKLVPLRMSQDIVACQDLEAQNEPFLSPEGTPYALKSDRICKDSDCDSICIPASRYADVQAGELVPLQMAKDVVACQDSEDENGPLLSPEGPLYAIKSDRICIDSECDSICIPPSRYAEVQAGKPVPLQMAKSVAGCKNFLSTVGNVASPEDNEPGHDDNPKPVSQKKPVSSEYYEPALTVGATSSTTETLSSTRPTAEASVSAEVSLGMGQLSTPSHVSLGIPIGMPVSASFSTFIPSHVASGIPIVFGNGKNVDYGKLPVFSGMSKSHGDDNEDDKEHSVTKVLTTVLTSTKTRTRPVNTPYVMTLPSDVSSSEPVSTTILSWPTRVFDFPKNAMPKNNPMLVPCKKGPFGMDCSKYESVWLSAKEMPTPAEEMQTPAASPSTPLWPIVTLSVPKNAMPETNPILLPCRKGGFDKIDCDKYKSVLLSAKAMPTSAVGIKEKLPTEGSDSSAPASVTPAASWPTATLRVFGKLPKEKSGLFPCEKLSGACEKTASVVIEFEPVNQPAPTPAPAVPQSPPINVQAPHGPPPAVPAAPVPEVDESPWVSPWSDGPTYDGYRVWFDRNKAIVPPLAAPKIEETLEAPQVPKAAPVPEDSQSSWDSPWADQDSPTWIGDKVVYVPPQAARKFGLVPKAPQVPKVEEAPKVSEVPKAPEAPMVPGTPIEEVQQDTPAPTVPLSTTVSPTGNVAPLDSPFPTLDLNDLPQGNLWSTRISSAASTATKSGWEPPVNAAPSRSSSLPLAFLVSLIAGAFSLA